MNGDKPSKMQNNKFCWVYLFLKCIHAAFLNVMNYHYAKVCVCFLSITQEECQGFA